MHHGVWDSALVLDMIARGHGAREGLTAVG